MDTKGTPFRSVTDLLTWCESAPEGTRLEARSLARILEELAPESVAPKASPVLDPPTWRERLWTVPAETRMGVTECAEALGRPRSYVYARTGPKSERPIPHRKLDGSVVFTAGEIRHWIRSNEEVVAAGPMESTKQERTLNAL